MSKEHKVISVEYKLYKDTVTGDVLDASEENKPMVFLSNVGQMIPEFENNVAKLNKGEAFSFGIKAENAYGTRMEDALADVPHEIFMQEGKLAAEVVVGNVLPLQDQNGHTHRAKVVSINETTVTVDVNHPLADVDLYFTGKVIDVRPATAEEVAHGHVHGAGGHHH